MKCASLVVLCLILFSAVLMVRYNRLSSENNLAVDSTEDGRSLMYIRNSRGASTVPWGTLMLLVLGLIVHRQQLLSAFCQQGSFQFSVICCHIRYTVMIEFHRQALVRHFFECLTEI